MVTRRVVHYAPGALLLKFLLAFVLPVTLFAWLLFAIARSRVLFTVTISRGRITDVSGRIPPALVGDLEDVFAKTDTHGTLVGYPEQGRARVEFRGRVRPEVLQRARNTVGLLALTRFTGQSPR